MGGYEVADCSSRLASATCVSATGCFGFNVPLAARTTPPRHTPLHPLPRDALEGGDVPPPPPFPGRPAYAQPLSP